MESWDTDTQKLSLDIPIGVPLAPGLLRYFPLGKPPSMTFLSLGRGARRIIGRADTCDVILDDSNVSREHAAIEEVSGGWQIDDLNSSNGVFVNGRPVHRGMLFGGEVIRVGSSLLRFLSVGLSRIDQLYPLNPREEMILGPGLEELRSTLDNVAQSNLSVLVIGETGTGKELVARYLHQRGPRATRPLVTVNCASIPQHLVESELFGHVKGAFTGASRERRGYIREAHGGTLFLDEIGELPLSSQPKLLRVLQDHVVVPVGSQKGHPVDIRVVAATNQDLEAQVGAGTFRQDIYARLAEMVVPLPPLRDRISDLPLLVCHFLLKHGRPDAVLTVDAAEFMSCQRWPRNIRQLESAVRRALVLAQGERYLAPSLFSDVAQGAEPRLDSGDQPPVTSTPSMGIQPAVRDNPFRAMATMPAHRPAAKTLLNAPRPVAPDPEDHPEAAQLRDALQRHRANVSEVAAELGISVSQVYRRAKKHSIRIALYRS